MIKTSISILIVLLVGLAIAAPIVRQNTSSPDSSLASLTNRLEQLEQELKHEIEQRRVLEKQIEHEREQRLAIASQISELNAHNDALSATMDNRAFSAPNPMNRSGDHQNEIDLLIDAGFDSADAQRIVELETDLQRQILSSRFGPQRVNVRELFLEMNQTLRTELGDEKYEQYLETTGRPTSVAVGQVVPGSAGEEAGLQIGDNIISYDGERVFSISDLQQATQSGTEGQTVVMEIEREGIPVTLVLPRGQIGISAGNFSFRRGNPPID